MRKFEIKDSGLGIPKAEHEAIFDKFSRGSNVINEGIEGTGMGLFISREIIQKHGGRFWFASEENKGDDAVEKDGKFLIQVKDQKLYNVVSLPDYSETEMVFEVKGKGFEIYSFTFG